MVKTNMLNILGIDANVLMETWFKRKNYVQCQNLLEKYDKLYITSLTTHIINYFNERYKYDYIGLKEYIDEFIIINFTSNDYQTALSFYDGNDFEDCLQMAMFLNNGIKKVITLDKELKNRFGKFIEFIIVA